MKLVDGYLSDEELAKLILEVEEQELVPAPPEMMGEILTKLETQKSEQTMQVRSIESKRKEFYRYCMRVITSVAAAVALVFLMPNMESVERLEVPSRQELVGSTITREEALNKAGVITQIMNFLNKKIGG